MNSQGLYVDANATYPVPPEHYDQVAAALKVVDGNPSSIHARGREAKVALENARQSLAKLVDVNPSELIFTAGATEANNLAIQGVVMRAHSAGRKAKLVVGATEHPSVLEVANLMVERNLAELAVAPVRSSGEIDVDALLRLVDASTDLVAVMHGNNETGAVNDLKALAPKLKAVNPALHLHVDGVQMLGKHDFAVGGGYKSWGIDSAAFSAHKIGGFKGIGALYLKAQAKIALLVAGGGQERGRRPGTENMPGIVSFGLRCQDVRNSTAKTVAAMTALRDGLCERLSRLDGAVIHGQDAALKLANTVNFHMDGVGGDDILLNFDLAGLQASSGSACSSGVARPSHVLLAMGYSEWVALNSVRISFSAEGTATQLDQMISVLRDVARRVRR